MPVIASRVFYFVRHGRTEANAQGLMCGGEWDIDLNEEGTIQARAASDLISSLEPRINGIFCSPMRRARQTSELINAQTKLTVEIIEDLREWRVGEWESKPWGEVPNPFNTTEDPPGGERRLDFESRIERAVAGVLNNFPGIPLFVSHGAAAHALFTVLGADKLQIENCVIYRVEPNGLRWIVSKAT